MTPTTGSMATATTPEAPLDTTEATAGAAPSTADQATLDPAAPGAMHVGRGPRLRRRIPPVAYGLLVVAIFAGVIGGAMAAGVFKTTGRTGGGSGAGAGTTELTGESTIEVKGWMAVGDVAGAFGVALPDLLAAFELPTDTPPATALKDLESDLFSVPALRDWLEAHAATP